jgi:hypothetical protein
MSTDAMICVHLLPSVLIGVEDKAIKNPRRVTGGGLKTISIFAFHSSLFSAPASAQQQGAEPESEQGGG